jgi:ATP-dependent RNA helicase DDX24/MAK5
MSKTGQKRSKSTEIPNSSRKRRKVDCKPKETTSTKTASATSVATLSANELAWREVTPPERLDDAEGFLGLEEIEGVEVVRDERGNHTHFRVYTIYSILARFPLLMILLG